MCARGNKSEYLSCKQERVLAFCPLYHIKFREKRLDISAYFQLYFENGHDTMSASERCSRYIVGVVHKVYVLMEGKGDIYEFTSIRNHETRFFDY